MYSFKTIDQLTSFKTIDQLTSFKTIGFFQDNCEMRAQKTFTVEVIFWLAYFWSAQLGNRYLSI